MHTIVISHISHLSLDYANINPLTCQYELFYKLALPGRRGCWYRLRVIWQTSLEGSVRGSAVAGSGPVRSEDPECSLWHAARSPSYSRSCSVVNSARAPSACCSSHSCCTGDWAGRPRSSCSIKCRDYAPKNTRRVSLWTSPDWLPS